jgi:hypothetical protein
MGCDTNVYATMLQVMIVIWFTHESMKIQRDGEENRQKGRQAESQRGRQAERYATKY